jgi:putative endonuclease
MLAWKWMPTFVGMTSDLSKRVWEHKNGVVEGFTKRYDVGRLVYFEPHEESESAIRRERQLKEWRRDWKINLIERSNPHWDDLYEAVCQ